MLPRQKHRGIAPLAIAAIMGGCGRDNGLPRDLDAHLAARGIHVHATESYAPLSSRAGFIVFDQDAETEARIISEFALVRIDLQDPMFRAVSGRVRGQPLELRGIVGRPATLRLNNGGQFEYLYLLTTADRRTYLFAEYAYG